MSRSQRLPTDKTTSQSFSFRDFHAGQCRPCCQDLPYRTGISYSVTFFPPDKRNGTLRPHHCLNFTSSECSGECLDGFPNLLLALG